MIARLRRAITFARHMPPAKLYWRVRLTAQRRLDRRRPPSLGGSTPPLAGAPPLPVFPPRTAMIAREGPGWRFSFLGRSVAFPGAIDWRGAAGEGQLWRMNLHYFEYLEELGAAEGLALMREWIAANPAYRTPGYWLDNWNSYTLSLRSVCWMQFMARHGLRDADILAAIAEQLRFLERNLERDLGGNHLIKNIKALAWGAAFFAGDEAERWGMLAGRLLGPQLREQILPDGVHYERSPSYHAQVLADLIETRRALGPAPDLDAAIARMAQAAVDLAHPDGLAAEFNDAGLTMAYPPATCAEAAEITAVPRRVFGYPEAGYFGAHLAAWSIIADMGPIGPDDLPAHAHGDIGSFELSVGGERFIVDQGVFEYIAGPRRQQSRAASSHGCLALDGADQAEFFGSFRCGRRPRVQVDRWGPRDDGFVLEGRHDGYRHLPGNPVVVRRFEVDEQAITITDRIEGTTDRAASIGLLLHPECRIEREREDVVVSRADAAIRIGADQPIAIEPAVWWPDMGHEMATSRLRLTWPRGCGEGRLGIRPAGQTTAGQS